MNPVVQLNNVTKRFGGEGLGRVAKCRPAWCLPCSARMGRKNHHPHPAGAL